MSDPSDYRAMALKIRTVIRQAPAGFTPGEKDLCFAVASVDSMSFKLYGHRYFGPDGNLRVGATERLYKLWQKCFGDQQPPRKESHDSSDGPSPDRGPIGSGGQGEGDDAGPR